MNKILFSLYLLLLPMSMALGQTGYGGDYDPSNPPDPNRPKVKYTLSVGNEPIEGGRTNVNKTKLAAGDSVYLSASPSSGFVFKEWREDNNCISKEATFRYVMPAKNTSILCLFEYKPNNPDDPQRQEEKFLLTVVASPVEAGRINIGKTRVAAGDSVYICAYPASSYSFKEWQMNGVCISTEQYFYFKMPSESTTIVGIFEYDPTSPTNPGGYAWNSLISELTIDDCKAGTLRDKVTSTLQSNYLNAKDVLKLTVLGEMNSSDMYIGTTLPDCRTYDYYKVSGLLSVPSFAYKGNEAIRSISLPKSVEAIGEQAFGECPNLEAIYCYAEEPPSTRQNAFKGIASTAIAYVPASSLDLYENAVEWKDLVLRPLVDNYVGFQKMSIWPQKGERIDILLREKPNMTFSEGNLCVVTEVAEIDFPMSNFNKITYSQKEDDDPTGIAQPLNELSLLYRIDNNSIVFHGTNGRSILHVYSIDGKLIDKQMCNSSSTFIYNLDNLPKGVYCISFDAVTFKVFVR